ncbi:MMPL family transporter [Cellulomonas chengniuliangii]|uniref:MMPL family transporter n=1 Tax=Cellulomonas chengniuliangii TaxID=2968084 RepID=A0ABY5L3E5_9CELL|nr:MMPL family transporter [Cellulomonas chengniuliangii]MCC2309333.1 MMPL family transporter [Cellulomonas chengniuliangii]MCC2316603.1 MMPL family transporter [Cellulomonas chengniuliangii]UUI75098.1 MMPL family transporter [Cellulomonas chengniuliangii]
MAQPTSPAITTATSSSGRRRGLTAPTQRIAIWSATHRAKAILLWLAAIAVALALGAVQSPREATPLELGVGESGEAARIAADAGHLEPAIENVLVSTQDAEMAEAETASAEAADALRALDEVDDVRGPVPSDDGSALLLQVVLAGDADTASERVASLQEVVADVQAAHPGLRVEQVGPGSIGAEFQEWLEADLAKATSLSLPVTLGILLVVFGAIVMAGIPVVLAISSVGAGLGLWSLVSQVVPDPGMVVHLLVLVGMAVGVDYSLFYLRRFREERHAGLGEVDAIRVAAATAGHSVVVSGVAVILSMAGLYFAGDAVFTAMATGSIIVIAIALVSSVTVLPALLATFGRWVDRPRVPVLWRLSNGGQPRVVPALVRPVLAHPVVALVASLAVLGAMAYPLMGLSLKNTQLQDLPRALDSMQAYDRLLEAFPDSSASDVVVVRAPAGGQAVLAEEVEALVARTEAQPDLFGAADEPWFSADGRTAVVQVHVPHALASDEARDSVEELREVIVPETVGSIAGAEAAVGGEVASDLDYTANLARTLPVVMAAVLLLVFAMMLWAYRSVALAIITVVLNVLSLAASFGLLTLVFQGSWAEGFLGFTSTGHVVSWVPMLLFVVLCGLSLDYHVFVVSRIRENALRGLSAEQAIHDGVIRTAGVVTSAAVVMIAVFSIFGALSFIELKQIGVGLAVGIALDATIIRVISLPAMLLLSKRLLWWRSTPTGEGLASGGTAGPEHVLAGRR